MATGQRIGGIQSLQVDGLVLNAKSNWTINLGRPKRTGIVGADRIHGHMEVPQIAFMEGVVSVTPDTNLNDLLLTKDATITLVGANKTYLLRNAVYAGEGDYTTEEGELAVRFGGDGDVDEG